MPNPFPVSWTTIGKRTEFFTRNMLLLAGKMLWMVLGNQLNSLWVTARRLLTRFRDGYLTGFGIIVRNRPTLHN